MNCLLLRTRNSIRGFVHPLVRQSVGRSVDTSRKVRKRAFPPLPTRPQLVAVYPALLVVDKQLYKRLGRSVDPCVGVWVDSGWMPAMFVLLCYTRFAPSLHSLACLLTRYPSLWSRYPSLWSKIPGLWGRFPSLWERLPSLWARLPSL